MIKKKDLSNKDRKVWEDYIRDPSDIYDKEKNNFLNQEKIDLNLIFMDLL